MREKRLKPRCDGFISRPPLTKERVETIIRLVDNELFNTGEARIIFVGSELEALDKWSRDMMEWFDRKVEIKEKNHHTYAQALQCDEPWYP